DLRPEPCQLLFEERALARRAADDHARHTGPRETADLVRGERPARDVDERLRASAGSVTEPLGLAAGEEDRFHRALPFELRLALGRLGQDVRRRRRAADALVGEA